MKEQLTAMQELRDDLVLTLENGNEALNEISDPFIRKTCQKLIEMTLNKIIKRIDDELLEMERQQITNAHSDGTKRQIENSKLYYFETFKSE